MNMALTQMLRKCVREAAQRPALRQGAEVWTYGDLHERSARLAAALHAHGLQAGDRVGMLAPNGLLYPLFMWATWWAGGVINPVNVRWSVAEIAYALDDSQTRILLVDEPLVATAQALRGVSTSLQTLIYCGSGVTPEGMLSLRELWATHAPAQDHGGRDGDLAMIMYTGGTTGKSKGVMLSHANLYVATLGSIAMSPRPMHGRALMVAPLFHIAALGTSLRMLRQQAQQVFLPGFDEGAVLEAIEACGITDMFLVPTMIRRVIDHPDFARRDTSSMRSITYGAAAIDPTLLERAMTAFPQVQFSQAYGMTELSPTITMLTPEEHLPNPKRAQRLRSAGRPMLIAEVRVVDEQDRELQVGQVGEICARGPMVMMGYWNLPELTAEALRGGWMHTGDAGYFDEDGFLYVVDRIKDMVVSGGENVYSAEVESVVTQLHEVSQCAIIGVPDARWGERVHAVIVPAAGQTVTLEAIAAHCHQHIAGYKCPRSMEIVEALPLSAAGKVLKNVLRAPHWQGQGKGVA